jgi:hypothetical protein
MPHAGGALPQAPCLSTTRHVRHTYLCRLKLRMQRLYFLDQLQHPVFQHGSLPKKYGNVIIKAVFGTSNDRLLGRVYAMLVSCLDAPFDIFLLLCVCVVLFCVRASVCLRVLHAFMQSSVPQCVCEIQCGVFVGAYI